MTLHRCASPACPGYLYPASEIAHPLETCGPAAGQRAAAPPPGAVDLAAIRARAKAATPGPWFSTGPVAGHTHAVRTTSGESVGHRMYEEDAGFIASARADVPALCDALEAARSAFAVAFAGIGRERDEARAETARLRGIIDEAAAGLRDLNPAKLTAHEQRALWVLARAVKP